MLERPALNLVESDRIHEKFRPQNPQKLTHVQLRHQNLLVALEDIAQIRRKRIEVPQVQVADLATLGTLRLQCRGNRSGRRAPGDDEQIAFQIAGGEHIGDLLRDRRDLRRPDAHHIFVVQRFIVDVAGGVLLLEAADAMFEPGSSWNRPRPRQCLRVALVGEEAMGVARKFHREIRNLAQLRNPPRLCAVCKVAVRKNDDGHHVLDRDPARFNRDPETICRSRRREYGNRRFGVTAK